MENILQILDHLPVGFRFRPTDEELVNYYLKHKLLGDVFPVHIIPEIDLCRVEPWDVAAKSVIKSDDPEWFFFSPVDYKYSNSKRVNRTTKRGFWKATGNDRNIRISGTNNVIGTKKTLVFHEGRVPRGTKTNWVIHEYQAVNSHQTQKTFVLCRLMKKAGKTTEREIEAPIFYQGEPSRRVVSNNENQLTAERILSVDPFMETDMDAIFQAIQESQIGVEQEALYPDAPLLNACFGNENINKQTPSEATDNEEEFVNSIWVSDEEFVINEERRQCFVNSSTQPKSVRGVYESSGRDAEVVSNMHENISSGESSCDSTVDESLEINCIEISSSPSTPTRLKNQYHLDPDNFMVRRTVVGRPQTQRMVSAVSHVKARNELVTIKSEKDQKNAKNTSSREKLEARSNQSSDINRKGSFIYMETISSSQSLLPRSVYLMNVFIGILLLIVMSWEVLSC